MIYNLGEKERNEMIFKDKKKIIYFIKRCGYYKGTIFSQRDVPLKRGIKYNLKVIVIMNVKK